MAILITLISICGYHDGGCKIYDCSSHGCALKQTPRYEYPANRVIIENASPAKDGSK